jgi:hypothetical protein
MLNNVKDFGAVGDGIADDRTAIQAAIDDALATRKAGVLFPAGTYRVTRNPTPGGRWSLDLKGTHDLTIAGEGPGSVVKLADSTAKTGDWHVFILRNGCQRVVFRDLVVDGNRSGLIDPDEQSHGIEVEEGTEDLLIEGCILRECFGDGIRLLGRSDTAGGENVKRVRILNCLFQTNKRSGLGIQRALEQIIVSNCIFDRTLSDTSIDFEPTGSDGPTDLLIQGCLINHVSQAPAVTLSGIGGPNPLLRCKFSDNIVLGGNVFCTDVAKLTIQNNTVIVPSSVGKQRIPIQVQRGGDSVLISGNVAASDSMQTSAVISLGEVNARQVTRAMVANNLCYTRSGRGIECLGSDDVSIQGNMVVATGPCTQGIHLHAEASPMDSIAVRDNDVTVEGGGAWETGIRFSAPKPIRHVSVTGNAVRGAAEGVSFQGDRFEQTPLCALNRVAAGVTSPIVGLARLPERSLVVGGAANRGGAVEASGGGRFLTGLGNPQEAVAGNVGDLFQRVDGGAGSSLYVKEAGNGTKSGWRAV